MDRNTPLSRSWPGATRPTFAAQVAESVSVWLAPSTDDNLRLLAVRKMERYTNEGDRVLLKLLAGHVEPVWRLIRKEWKVRRDERSAV